MAQIWTSVLFYEFEFDSSARFIFIDIYQLRHGHGQPAHLVQSQWFKRIFDFEHGIYETVESLK